MKPVYAALIWITSLATSSAQFNRPFSRPQNVLNNLFTPMMQTPTSQGCFATGDNKEGQCMNRAICLSSGGTVVSSSSCSYLASCCVYKGSCRATFVAQNRTYFTSPVAAGDNMDEFNRRADTPSTCIFTLQRNNPYAKKYVEPICQIRLDFEEFQLSPPKGGNCGGAADAFIVSGASNLNASGLPTTGLCGDLTGQHLYFDIDPNQMSQPLLLVVTRSSDDRVYRKWSIKVTQIECRSPYRAPPGCLQYHQMESGNVESFNVRGSVDDVVGPTTNPNYLNGLNYGICIAKRPGYCSIEWMANQFDIGGSQVGQSTVGQLGTGQFGSACLTQLGLEDTGDYIVINGGSRDGVSSVQHLFCGQILSSIPGEVTNAPIVSFAKPFNLLVKTDRRAETNLGTINQRGFQIRYRQKLCQ